jgi:hypothetical protein
MNVSRAKSGWGLLRLVAGFLVLSPIAGFSLGQNATKPNDAPGTALSSGPIPSVRNLMLDVAAHQKQLEKVRENYTFHSSTVIQDLDSNGKVTKTESEDSEVFYVNTHRIERTVKKDGKPLSDHDQQKEQERVTKLVEKAPSVPPGEPLEGPKMTVSILHLLDIMDVYNPRRVI